MLKSKSQMGWMFANKPELAKEFAAETTNIRGLPQKVGEKSTKKPKFKKKKKKYVPAEKQRSTE